MAPDDEEAAERLRQLGPLIKPLSDAEIAKRRRMYEEAGTLNMDSLRCLTIFILEGLA